MEAREHINVAGIGNPQWYSSVARYGDLVWTAGQVPIDAEGNTPEAFADQVDLTLDNLQRVLDAAGASFDTLIKVNAYLADLDDFESYNEVYVRRIGPHSLPPRTTVEIVRFPPPLRIELEAVAHVRQPS